MRIDKFLNSSNITKKRTIAQDMLHSGVVKINDTTCKASKNVAVGDVITITFLKGVKRYKVLELPTTKSTPKSEQDRYFKEL